MACQQKASVMGAWSWWYVYSSSGSWCVSRETCITSWIAGHTDACLLISVNLSPRSQCIFATVNVPINSSVHSGMPPCAAGNYSVGWFFAFKPFSSHPLARVFVHSSLYRLRSLLDASRTAIGSILQTSCPSSYRPALCRAGFFRWSAAATIRNSDQTHIALWNYVVTLSDRCLILCLALHIP